MSLFAFVTLNLLCFEYVVMGKPGNKAPTPSSSKGTLSSKQSCLEDSLQPAFPQNCDMVDILLPIDACSGEGWHCPGLGGALGYCHCEHYTPLCRHVGNESAYRARCFLALAFWWSPLLTYPGPLFPLHPHETHHSYT